MYYYPPPRNSTRILHFSKFLIAVFAAALISIPWQLYIKSQFPIEAAASYAHNRLHMTATIGGHVGDMMFYVNWMEIHFGKWLMPFILIGSIGVLVSKEIQKSISISLLSMCFVIYGFFSFFVPTKMPAFTFPVYGIMLTLISYGLYHVVSSFFTNSALLISKAQKLILMSLMFLVSIYSLKPWQIVNVRHNEVNYRAVKSHNTLIYKNLPASIAEKYIILNCKEFEDVELMFYTNANAYHWWFPERTLDSLQNLGHQFAAFPSYGNQVLPDYILKDSTILILDAQLQ